jgi:hypothetical protein
MEPIIKGEKVTLDNNKQFYVVDIVYDDNQKYIYFANDDDGLEIMLGKESILDNGEVIIEPVSDEEEIKRIMIKIVNNISNNNM